MDKSLIPLVLSALALAAIIGVLFQQVFPATKIDASLGALFALAGFLMALVLRTSWRAVRGSDR